MAFPLNAPGELIAVTVKNGSTVAEGDIVRTDGASNVVISNASAAASSTFCGIVTDSLTGDGTKTVNAKKTGIYLLTLTNSEAFGTSTCLIGAEVYASGAQTCQVTSISNAVKIGKIVKGGPTTSQVWVKIDGYAV